MSYGNRFYIGNDGTEIKETDYFKSTQASMGAFFMSLNKGCFRLLVPKQSGMPRREIKVAAKCDYVIITRGLWLPHNVEAMEVLFEDHSDTPFSIHFKLTQMDLVPNDESLNRNNLFALYTEKGKQFEKNCFYRKATTLPHLKPL